MPDLDTNKPDSTESKEQSPEPSPQSNGGAVVPTPGRSVTLGEIQATHDMLVGFRKGIKQGSFTGDHLIQIAQGLQFLDNMVAQSQGQLEMAIRMEKEMKAKAPPKEVVN